MLGLAHAPGRAVLHGPLLVLDRRLQRPDAGPTAVVAVVGTLGSATVLVRLEHTTRREQIKVPSNRAK